MLSFLVRDRSDFVPVNLNHIATSTSSMFQQKSDNARHALTWLKKIRVETGLANRQQERNGLVGFGVI